MVKKVEVRDVPDRVADELLLMARREKKSRNRYLKEILIDIVEKEDTRVKIADELRKQRKREKK